MKLDGAVVIITDYGKMVVNPSVLKAYGVMEKPKSNDGRRKEVREYKRAMLRLERNAMAIASHEFIMERDAWSLK